MLRRLRSDPLETDEMVDADLRKKIFREYGRDLSMSIKEGFVTDRPGEIARLMEKAYKAGLAAARLEPAEPARGGSSPTRAPSRGLSEIDVPSYSSAALHHLRTGIFGTGNTGGSSRRIVQELGAAVFFQPPSPSDPFGGRTGRWFVGGPQRRAPLSGKAMAFFEKEELLSLVDAGNGWKIGLVNEWGLEFLATGQTPARTDRKGRRSAFADHWDMLKGRGVLKKAAVVLGFFEEDHPAPSARFK